MFYFECTCGTKIESFNTYQMASDAVDEHMVDVHANTDATATVHPVKPWKNWLSDGL